MHVTTCCTPKPAAMTLGALDMLHIRHVAADEEKTSLKLWAASGYRGSCYHILQARTVSAFLSAGQHM